MWVHPHAWQPRPRTSGSFSMRSIHSYFIHSRPSTPQTTTPTNPIPNPNPKTTTTQTPQNQNSEIYKMRPSPRLFASALRSANANNPLHTPGPMALLPPIPLYRRLLRAHRKHLPVEMRVLGDEYVKAEFRAHRDVENPVHLVGFLYFVSIYLTFLFFCLGIAGVFAFFFVRVGLFCLRREGFEWGLWCLISGVVPIFHHAQPTLYCPHHLVSPEIPQATRGHLGKQRLERDRKKQHV